MSVHKRSVTFSAGADRVFEYLSDVGNLPRYFDRMTSAVPADGEAVRVTAAVGDREVEGEAWFRVDRSTMRLHWGSEGPSDYHGTLQVTADQDRSVVEIELETERGSDEEIDAGLDATLARIKEILES